MPTSHLTFPCPAMPEDPAVGRLLGLYPQVQDGRWMQRVKVLGGRLSSDHWRALAAIAREFTPSTPLHLTTRQDLELHDLSPAEVPLVQERLAAAGLTGLGACGDTMRNITVCACSGLQAGTIDLAPLAGRIEKLLREFDGIYALPRKFKISLSCCRDACSQPWINDLGLVLQDGGPDATFQAILGGSLGPKPGTGLALPEILPARDVLPLALAAMRVFAAQGDRQHRHKARLRHVRQRLGDAAFMDLLRREFDAVKRQSVWPEIQLQATAKGFADRIALIFDNGDVTPPQADALAALSADGRLAVRITNHHRILVFGPDRSALDAAIAAHPVLAAAAAARANVVACPGSRWCKRALTNTNALADAIRRRLGNDLPRDTFVCVSGCPNGCAHSTVADIGLVGMLSTRDGQKIEAYDLYSGGGMGRTAQLASLVAPRLPAEDVPAAISQLLGHHTS